MTRTCKPSDLLPGDSIAFDPVDAIGAAISLGCWRPWPFQERIAHFAMVATYDGQTCIYESTIDPGLGDCIHAEKVVAGVQAHGLTARLTIHGARGGRAWRLPLTLSRRRMWDSATMDWEWPYRSRLGTGYDFWGAWAARFALGGWRKWWRRPTPGAEKLLFCSEFVVAVYKQLSMVPRNVAPEKYNPKAAARMLVARNVCGPPEEIRL